MVQMKKLWYGESISDLTQEEMQLTFEPGSDSTFCAFSYHARRLLSWQYSTSVMPRDKL